MPAKYSHVKKRSASGLLKKSSTNGHIHTVKDSPTHRGTLNPHVDRSITQAMTAVSQLERAIARILLLRYEQDIARLFSTRLFSVALVHLPTFVMRCVTVGGPSWVAQNADCDEIKDFFRAAIGMDMRQAGERVATKSVLWTYNALRHFAMSNNVTICSTRGLHSLRLLPHYPALKAHLDSLESGPSPTFTKPPHLGPLTEGLDALEEACELKYVADRGDWPADWRPKIRAGYERVSQTLWRVAREFDVRGYGLVLRDKLTTKWCDCGCSTDHLAEVCERTVREDEEESGVRPGKQREWDGRGSGVLGWGTEEEEDLWELDLDFGGVDPEECEDKADTDMTIGELMEWRYLKAEREKETGNAAFRKGEFEVAAGHYEAADKIEPEIPHYQLNLAAAHLKLNNWMDAEKACTKALGQHRSGKGYFRRAKARKMLGRNEDAIKDLRALLRIQPGNNEAMAELSALLPPVPRDPHIHDLPADQGSSSRPPPSSSSSSARHPVPSNHDPALEPTRLKSKPPKPLPFERTKADDRKLRIALVPMTVDMPISSVPASSGKQKAKAKGAAAQMRAESFMYPNWERYVVRRISG
ncbi:hypothetical protein PLICRDRAFT_46283 [Plicaturopsis crispa FD-325 SS-3]|uniref:TPR-like protein n=1 Tax=Plicaturopsis crispa FD-325 SS-3 TaxID=944288 RepID=A0A0C9SKV1_PLICR|nr:hypothetical protein PLICRDRAFT_46283 [Plicaturopsis crispa FD-325 SS-3]